MRECDTRLKDKVQAALAQVRADLLSGDKICRKADCVACDLLLQQCDVQARFLPCARSQGVVQCLSSLPADVFYRGEMVWPRAIGLDACVLCVAFLRNAGNVSTVIDPFCGQGTTLAVANALGLNAGARDDACSEV
eukprot:763159-Hanusia_phi.AAC.13